MPTARLTSRQVAVGQHASPCFRRLFSPVACAGNERSNRSSLFSRTRLRDSSKLDNTLVATRSDSSGGERETHSETTALLREKQESEAKTDSEGITVLPSKTFHFDSPSDDVMPTEKEETPTSENPPSDQEKAEAQTDADGQIISRTADIIVAKRPSRPSLSRLVSMKRAKDANQPATEDPIALQNTSLPESSAVPNNVTYEPVQKVIVVKRKPQPPIKRPAVLPKPTVIKRVEDVLVVQKSSASNAASQQLPPPALSNGAKAILKGKPLPRTENKPVQPPVDSKEEKSPSNSGGGRVIERPRPKSLVQRSAKRPDLPKIPRSPTRAKMDVAEVLMKRRVRLAEQDEEASREAQSEQKRLTPLDDSSVQDTPPALDKESAVDSDKAISNETKDNQGEASQGSNVGQSSDDTKNVADIRSPLLKSAHTLYGEKELSADSKVTSNNGQVDLARSSSMTRPDGSQTEQSMEGEQRHPSTEASGQIQQATPPKKKVQLAKRPLRPGTPSKKPKPSRESSVKAAVKTSSPDIDFDRQFMRQHAEKAKEKNKRAHQKLEEERQERQEERNQYRSPKKEKPISAKKVGRTDISFMDSRRKARTERQEEREKDSDEEVEREMIIEVGAEGLSIEELAGLLAIDPTDVMKILFVKGIMIAVNQTLDTESVKVVAAEMDVEVLDKTEEDVTEMAKKEESLCEDEEQGIMKRPPVVTVMGHVDHGKTSLLDHIRRTRVVDGEAGGITQAIGAYTCEVEVEGEKRSICFLDTPGHEAFSAMRARGTRVTDIAIIVIAANDGIRPQTLEAISHAKAAEVPIVIAINKIDMPGADPERVKRELSDIELLPEEWGGKTPVVCISAKTGDNVQDLLEMVTLVSDIQLDLRANPEASAKGTVIEAFLDKRTGVVATVLVQNGTLHIGEAVVAGAAYGKVRSLTDERKQTVSDAGPSTAVQMLGFHEIPAAGDVFAVCSDETEAKAEAEKAAERIRRQHLLEAAGGGSMVTLSSLASVDDEDVDALQRLNLVLKGDTSGSIEAIKGALSKLPQEAVVIRYLHISPGDITESDILLAAAAEGMVVGFNVSAREDIKAVAKQKGVQLQNYTIIYDLIDDIRAKMEGRLKPTEDRLPIGAAKVRAVFGSGSLRVAGCMVTEGRLEKGCLIKVSRKKATVYEGPLTSLRRIKDKVEEVSAGLECGVGCDGYSEWLEGDLIEAFTVVQKQMTLEDSRATMAMDETELQDLIG